MKRIKRRGYSGGRGKKEMEFRHACRRACERFGLRLTENDIWEIIRKIQNNDAEHLYKQSNRVSHFLLTYDEQKMIVVYDKLRNMVVTFLEPEKYDLERSDNERSRSSK